MSLPLLPVADIDPAFHDVKELVQDDSPSKTLITQLCRYVHRQWISKSTIGVTRMSVRDNPARTNNAVESFHAALRRRVKVAHPNLYSFLGHLQRTTTDCENDIARLNRGMSIRRAKKRTYLLNEARIKACISRFDHGAYTRMQFLRAVSHSVGAHAVPDDAAGDSDAEDDDDDEVRNDRDDNDQPQSAVSSPQSQDLFEVCLVQRRDARLAFVLCGHQRFCASCVAQLEQQARGCPICRSDITMVL